MSHVLKKVAAIHDLSGYGKCSLTVAIPVLSAMGLECCALPTAILSSHTGFAHFSFFDFTPQMPAFIREWQRLDLHFDCIYSGFLGSAEQIELVEGFLQTFKKEDTLVLIDPVMGDNFSLYATYTPQMCQNMCRLVHHADIVTPNLTEACILTNTPFPQNSPDQPFLRKLCRDILKQGPQKVVITGIVNQERSLVQNFVCQGEQDAGWMGRNHYNFKSYNGTGDLFASIVTGYCVQGMDFALAVQKGQRFCMQNRGIHLFAQR